MPYNLESEHVAMLRWRRKNEQCPWEREGSVTQPSYRGLPTELDFPAAQTHARLLLDLRTEEDFDFERVKLCHAMSKDASHSTAVDRIWVLHVATNRRLNADALISSECQLREDFYTTSISTVEHGRLF